ncbi:LysE family translocator [Alkalinema sp. FACHB-956]|uniref:LysE family translocator n=1 Tax=Alkalinema sp. FACHB-956 TaxID=2692768 RepID=UPI001686BF13|nr:LysE family translocator [Alkalinema sp. FACHB-956]MBD2326271.1 LysE family translocator [Alkalinema sp. FACHB-956]
MTLSSTVALFSAMTILAAIPSVSVLTVVTRSASLGFLHGLLTSLGIVVGDVVFIIIAIWGLAFIVATMGGFFVLIKYLGGAYLIWLGIQLSQAQSKPTGTETIADASLISSFLAGLFITLGDQKAVLFYLGFFPAFLDLPKISPLDTAIVITIAILAVGGVKVTYAYMADRTRRLMKHPWINHPFSQFLNTIAGIVMIVVGLFLILRP